MKDYPFDLIDHRSQKAMPPRPPENKYMIDGHVKLYTLDEIVVRDCFGRVAAWVRDDAAIRLELQ